MIEKLRKRPVEVETMLWDGTDLRGYEIKAWAGRRTILVDGEAVLASEDRYDPAFVLPAEVTGSVEHALLWVAHNRDWCSLPIGYRVARELDGSGFYPLSPEGAAAGYEMPGEVDGAITHRCPPSGSSVMPCCGRTPFEAPGDRITVDPALVTCAAPAGEVVSVPDGWTRGLGESQDWDNGDVVVSVPPPGEPACCVDSEQGPDAHGTLLHTLGCRNRCGVDTTWYPPSSPLQGSPYPCGTTLGHEGDHWAPPALRTPLVPDGPAPVPPPVDALLKLIDEFGREAHAYGLGDDSFGDTMTDSWKEINSRVRALWAAGVEEGRRQTSGPVLAEVAAERMRQDVKWGEQNHPDGTGPHILWRPFWPEAADGREELRKRTGAAAADGTVTWLDIALEEMAEAFAEDDPAKLRGELIQAAAVAVAWIQAIDRRPA